MKRVIALSIALLVLLIAITSALSLKIDAQKDDVRFDENILFGDPASLEGLCVGMRAHYDDRLYWNVKYDPAASAVMECDYRFSLSDLHEYGPYEHSGLSMYVSYFYEWDTDTPIEELEGLSIAYRELYDATPEGEEVEKSVYVKDYYEYYPLAFHIDLPSTVWASLRPSGEIGFRPGDELYEYKRLCEYFKIPVLPYDKVTVTVDKDKSNGVMAQQGGSDSLSLYTRSTYTDDGVCYFSIYNRTNNGELIDTSHIPGGYGIYAVNFGRDTGVYDSGVYADSLRTVYALDENVIVKHITTNKSQTKLLLFTLEDDLSASYLTVIDIATMKEEQKLHIYDYDVYETFEYEDFLVVYASDMLILLEVDASGEYKVKFSVPVPYAVDERFTYLDTLARMDYDGERLAVVGALEDNRYGTFDLCGFYLAVYDESGLVFYGEYNSSLSANPRLTRYDFNCLPSGTYAFDVEWN